jgi:hypothetical protein
VPLPSITSTRPVAGLAARIGTYAAAGVLLAILVIGVLISPLVFNAIDSTGVDWNRLSDLGQAYGAVSALLSAAALCLVVLLQRHQVRHERVTMVRDMHLTVVSAAFDDPDLRQCWGPRMSSEPISEHLFYYTNMILMLWWYSFEIGELSEDQVRGYAGGMFASEIPREYWKTHGPWVLSGAKGRRRRFLQIVDAAFRAAESDGPPVRRHERADRDPRRAAVRRRYSSVSPDRIPVSRRRQSLRSTVR